MTVEKIQLTPVNEKFDENISFRCTKNQKAELLKLAGGDYPHYLRVMLDHLINQLKTEKAS